jgi:hypothetical protein
MNYMKYLIFSVLGVSMLHLSACSRRCTEDVAGPVFTGKVVKSMCGHIMVQFANESVTLGQFGWADPMDSGKVYDRVFKVANPCTWGKKDTASNITFRLIAPNSAGQNCAMCLAFTSTPDTAYHISVVE